MNKLLSGIFILSLFLPFFFSMVVLPAQASTAVSNCVITNIGNPPDDFPIPPECQSAQVNCTGNTGAICAFKFMLPYTDFCCHWNATPGNGRIHYGVDLIAPRGTDIKAIDDGTILENQHEDGGGNTVKMYDPVKKRYHLYLHLNDLGPVGVGKTVKRGDVIGHVGNTGDNNPSRIYHLHYQVGFVRFSTAWPDPEVVLKDWPTN